MVWLALAVVVGGVIWLDPMKRSKPTTRVATGAAVPIEQPIDSGVGNTVERQPIDSGVGNTVEQLDAAPLAPLYTVTEALGDVASGPLVFVGTGDWFGNYSIHGCAYRNARVIVVNVYCTMKEQPAFGLVVISPTRGHLNIYVEADAAISTLARTGYLTFRVEAEPVVPSDLVALEATYADLRAWDERRYNAHVGACWTGDGTGCSTGLESRLDAWAPSANEFLAAPPQAFYQLIKDMHTRAVHDIGRTR